MRKRKVFLLSMIMVITTLIKPCDVLAKESATEFTEKEHAYLQYKIEEYEGEMAAYITGCTIDKEEAWNDAYIKIPKELGGYPVRVIDEYAFRGQSQPWFVVLPEGIKEIRRGAFEGCTELLSVFIGRTVTVIDETTFDGCSSKLEIWTYEGSYAQYFAEEHGISYKIEEYITYEDEETGLLVQMKNTTLSDKNVEVKLDIITEGEEFESLTKGIEKDAVLYKVSFMLDGREIQPEGDTTIFLPIPSSICGYYSSAFVIEEDGRLRADGEVSGNGWQSLCFRNTGFGRFMVVGPHMFGDMDNDCEITASDALIVLKSVVGLKSLNEGQKETADVNDDEEVTAKDALCILRKIVDLQELPVITKIPI